MVRNLFCCFLQQIGSNGISLTLFAQYPNTWGLSQSMTVLAKEVSANIERRQQCIIHFFQFTYVQGQLSKSSDCIVDPFNLNLHNLGHCELQPTFLLSKDIWSLRTEAWKLPQPFLSIKVKNAMNKKRRHFWHCFVFCKVAKTQLGSSSSLLGNLYIKWTDSNSWVF